VLYRGTLGVGRQGEDKDAAPGFSREVQGGAQRFKAKIRAERDRVSRQRRAVAEPRIGVGCHGGADVPALCVGNGEHTFVTGDGKDFLQDSHSGRAVALVKRHLRLDGGSEGSHRVEDCQGKRAQAVDVVIQSPAGQQGRVRVNAHAQGATRGHGSAKPGAKGLPAGA
jgi:hypothetical protein